MEAAPKPQVEQTHTKRRPGSDHLLPLPKVGKGCQKLSICCLSQETVLKHNFCQTGADRETSGETILRGSQGQHVLPNVAQIACNIVRVAMR